MQVLCRLAAMGIAGTLAAALLPAAAGPVELATRHEPSGLNSAFTFTGQGVAEYVAATRRMVAQVRTDLDAANREWVIEANSAFELTPAATCPAGREKPFRRAVLLTHGLTDSPYSVRHLGRFFQQQCFRVLALLLPGHGTRPGDLTEVTWQEWVKAQAFGVRTLAQEADEIYLLGLSTGGALSLYQGLREPKVRALFLFAPAIRISKLAFLAGWLHALGEMFPRAKWLELMPDEDATKYESFAANAAYQLHLLTLELAKERKRQKNAMPPVFVVASEDDASVNTAATLDFFRDAARSSSTLMYYSTRKRVVLPDIAADKVILQYSVVPEQHIISSAHTALVLPPQDQHYGSSGDYAMCLHYFPDQMDHYRQCKNRQEDHLGEVTSDNLKRGVLRRLTYNFAYESMTAHLKEFIARLPPPAD